MAKVTLNCDNCGKIVEIEDKSYLEDRMVSYLTCVECLKAPIQIKQVYNYDFIAYSYPNEDISEWYPGFCCSLRRIAMHKKDCPHYEQDWKPPCTCGKDFDKILHQKSNIRKRIHEIEEETKMVLKSNKAQHIAVTPEVFQFSELAKEYRMLMKQWWETPPLVVIE